MIDMKNDKVSSMLKDKNSFQLPEIRQIEQLASKDDEEVIEKKL